MNKKQEYDRLGDFEWFIKNHINLHKQYGDGYYAIKNKTVIAVYPNIETALIETEKKHQRGEVSIQKNTGHKSDYFVKLNTIWR